MKDFKLLKEHDDHFIIDALDGKPPFRVAKATLHHGTVQKIRQHFADGGLVQQDPEAGGETASPEELQQIKYAAEDARNKAANQQFLHPTPVGDRLEQALESIQDPTYVAQKHAAATAAAIPASQGVPDMLAAPDPAQGAQPQFQMPPALPKPAPLPSVSGEFAAGEKQEIQGINASAGAVAAEGNANASVLDDLAKQRQALATEFQQRLAATQAKSDQLFGAIQAGHIDPGRIWKDATGQRDTGRTIMAGISVILGGIGAGLTGGPNYALDAINKAVDRDMEAQKLELGKKENLLNHYMQQGNSLMAAHSLAKADLLDVAGAQLQKTAAQFSGQKAQADAQTATGQLRQQAAAMRQQATERELQIRQGQIGLQQQQVQADAFRELMKGISGGGGFDRRVLEMPAFDKFRERAVDLPDGTVAFAPDKAEAEKAREAFGAVATLKAKISRFNDLLKNGNPATLDRGTAQAQRADILAEMGHLHGLNRLSDKDLELFQQQVPDLTDLFKPMAAQKLNNLGKSIDDKVWATQSAYLTRPRGRRPGG